MKYINHLNENGNISFEFKKTAMPTPKSDECLIQIKAIGVNRADILQSQGKYPPPSGASEILGLEMSGIIISCPPNSEWAPGDRVMTILDGGSYAEYCAVHHQAMLPIPENLTFEQAAAIPEAFITGFQALKWLGNIKSGETTLIHAGGSGVGTASIQMAKNIYKANVITTCSESKIDKCISLGADFAIDYNKHSFDEEIKRITKGEGADVIIDFLLASYFQKNLKSAALDGRIVLLAMLGGFKSNETNLIPLISKRLTITGSTLRNRSLEYKIKLIQDFRKSILRYISDGTLKPIIHQSLSWENVKIAHQTMSDNKNFGKLILTI
ncbi:NAD(P)H-quinone oxidoreductase [Aureibacter tunicatorum]|uniref:PIG3 family NAD(P)H quinone oxidoreductase n=1 Tax=Aureibacter tunicatorum TaxID=866807 RepID=A0AAE4BS66_9BACT|nr:NAD(P)H-quinone oxidoreductase [Aureibacter tunicatorum]MDR6239441.1 putative PIG3 family NAD(P)H quinone oxidoreductase [Aureibacter tunicatorum]BDD04636.1 NAD(P)H quinone oxidoreductase [Aureibacter tunicatorum]